MSGRLADVIPVTALAGVITLLLAVPVLRAPSERVFGAEIVGRHHDPYTVMQLLERPVGFSLYTQPITDVPGALLARVVGGVTAYNWLVLISFPLTAAAGFLLARHLMLSTAGATVAALACAFSPFHLAQAAYHPHIAQTQWLLLYLLALWRCLDTATLGAAAALAAAVVGVTLSNYYGGFIAAFITPIAVGAYWFATRRAGPQPITSLLVTIATLLLCALAVGSYVWWAASAFAADREALGFARADLFRYGARWWSYLVPPIGHPVLGSAVTHFWIAAGESKGLLEQQVSLGWGVMALGVAAIAAWCVEVRPVGSNARVPVLVAVALVAMACSLAPDPRIAATAAVTPSVVLHELLPMFRSYARFAVVVQFMAAVLAGIGVDALMRRRTQRSRLLCFALLAMVAAEYAVAPSALWRDALPTTAHRWTAQETTATRVLDCHPLSEESASIPWLTHSRITMLTPAISDCSEPNVSQKLAALGYTHMLIRQARDHDPAATPHTIPDGLRLAAAFDDGLVLAVATERPSLHTSEMAGFSPREHNREWSWRWMGAVAAWAITGTSPGPLTASLDLEASAFQHERRMTVWLDGVEVQSFIVSPARRNYRIGPFRYSPGSHALVFRTSEPPTIADDVLHNGDRRPLSFAIGTWMWRVDGDQQ